MGVHVKVLFDFHQKNLTFHLLSQKKMILLPKFLKTRTNPGV
jgi:hypothetical protein